VRRDLPAQQRNSPMPVINGADDYFVPQGDTLVFEDRPNTEVHLIPGTGHVAMSKAAEPPWSPPTIPISYRLFHNSLSTKCSITHKRYCQRPVMMSTKSLWMRRSPVISG
jgi:hypothetical protein